MNNSMNNQTGSQNKTQNTKTNKTGSQNGMQNGTQSCRDAKDSKTQNLPYLISAKKFKIHMISLFSIHPLWAAPW